MKCIGFIFERNNNSNINLSLSETEEIIGRLKEVLNAKSDRQLAKYSMTDQMRRSSRSVCSNITKAMRKRRFKTPVIAKLNDSESAACETQVWLEFARLCNYLDDEVCSDLEAAYDQIMGQLAKMISHPEKWLF